MSSKLEQLQALLAPVVEALGYQCWGIEFLSQGRHSLLRVYIDKADGILIDDCEIVSRQLSGVLDYSTGPLLREQGARLIAASSATRLALDCSTVEKSSSVGLALLLAFMRDARKAGRELTISALPDDMREIAKVSGLLELLPLQQ